jgi:lactoylglutathione lyase
MFSKVDYVMVNVSEMGRSVTFYRDTLGLPLKFESTGWSEFQTGATTLALHVAAPRVAGEDDANAGPAAGTCSIGFMVENLDATYAELRSRGARFVMTPTDQANEGIRLAVCVDPDGLAISFAEPIAREASGGQ